MTIADSNRDEIVIALAKRATRNNGGGSRKAILSEIDKSLKRQDENAALLRSRHWDGARWL